jgi:hypothetical protein
MVRKYVHYASAQAMISERQSSPLDHMGLSALKGHKVDRILNRNPVSHRIDIPYSKNDLGGNFNKTSGHGR